MKGTCLPFLRKTQPRISLALQWDCHSSYNFMQPYCHHLSLILLLDKGKHTGLRSLLSNSLCSWVSRYLHNLQLHTKPLLHTPRFGRFLRIWFHFLERFAVIVCLCPFCSTHDAQVFWLLHLCGSCKITILSDFLSSSSASLIFPLLQAVHVSLEFCLVSLRTFRESQSGCLETNCEDKPFFFTESDLSIDLTSRGLHQGFLWGLSGLSLQYWLCSSPDFLHSWDLIWFLNNFSGKWDHISWSIF